MLAVFLAYFILSACSVVEAGSASNEQVIGGGRGGVSAAQATCPNPQHPDLDYNCPLGPTYLIPGLTDLNGWTKPSQYQNILLGDLDGDGVDELVARSAGGIQVYRFDRPRGQWTQVQSRTSPTNKTTILSDAVIGTDAEHRKYWDTIRLGDIDGDGKDELVVRLSTGVVVFRFTPFPLKSDWDSGIWEQVTASGPLADTDAFAHGGHWGDDPSNYSTIRLAPIGRQGAKPTMQLVGRGRDGVELFRWNGTGWTQLTTLPDLSSAEGFDAPEYYTTILIWNDILLARFPSGMRAYEFNAGTGTWRLLASDGPLGDAAGWNKPEYYSTIQLFHFRSGGGGGDIPLFAARGSNGVEVGGLFSGIWLPFVPPDHVHPLSDADGFAQPQYYRTMQVADIDGDGFDELLARRAGGIVIYRLDPQSDKWSGPISADEPALADDPWAKDASYYTAIKTARLDPSSPARSLVARGAHGIRTWRFDTGASTWTRYVPYGNFPAVDATAFAALNTFLGIQSGTIRTVYTDPTNDPTSNQLASFQNEISARCTGEITAGPPQFQSCTPPSNAPGVSPAAWTAVSNQIIAELFWAQQVVDHFQTIHDMQTTLFIDEINQNTTLVEDLKLVQQENVIAQVDYLSLFESILYILSNLPIPGLDTVFDVTAGALSVADAATLHGSAPSQFDRTIAQVQAEMTTLQQEMQDAVTAHRHYVLGDYGLLSTVGHLVGSEIWTLDTQAALSAGRQGFAVWLYEQFLPALWDRWTVLNCANFGFLRDCQPPLDPDSPTELEALAMLEFSPTTSPGADDPAVGSGIWDGLVPKQNGACGDGCRWETLEGQHYGDVLTTLRGSVTPACTFNPTGTSWEYGCNLGVSAAELSSWSFRHVQCDYSRPNPDNAGLECFQAQPTELAGGDVRVIGTPWGSLDLSIEQPLEGKTLDLRQGKVTLRRLVHEGGVGGALELVNSAGGQDLTPRTLTLTGGAVGHALFSTPPGEVPSILGAVTVHQETLRVSMRITGASLDSTQLCGADSTTHLGIHLIVEDAGNQPIQTLTMAPYQCRTDRNGVVRRLTFRPAAALAPIP